MKERFQQLQAEFPEYSNDYTPPWGLPTEDDFVYLAERYGLRYPPSFVLFQTQFAASLPQPDNAFRWANRGLEPYLSLEAAITGSRQMGVPNDLAPFWEDEGNFTCFNTTVPDANGEFPVEFWDHDAGGAIRETPDFIEWLRRSYQRTRER